MSKKTELGNFNGLVIKISKIKAFHYLDSCLVLQYCSSRRHCQFHSSNNQFKVKERVRLVKNTEVVLLSIKFPKNLLCIFFKTVPIIFCVMKKPFSIEKIFIHAGMSLHYIVQLRKYVHSTK